MLAEVRPRSRAQVRQVSGGPQQGSARAAPPHGRSSRRRQQFRGNRAPIAAAAHRPVRMGAARIEERRPARTLAPTGPVDIAEGAAHTPAPAGAACIEEQAVRTGAARTAGRHIEAHKPSRPAAVEAMAGFPLLRCALAASGRRPADWLARARRRNCGWNFRRSGIPRSCNRQRRSPWRTGGRRRTRNAIVAWQYF
jgi:hypothetical protein